MYIHYILSGGTGGAPLALTLFLTPRIIPTLGGPDFLESPKTLTPEENSGVFEEKLRRKNSPTIPELQTPRVLPTFGGPDPQGHRL